MKYWNQMNSEISKMKPIDLIDTEYIEFLIDMSELLQSCKIQTSRVDEDIIRKTQCYEQEMFYKELYTGIDSEVDSKDLEIIKTLKYGCVWMI
jgi:hypothetical protein